MNKLFDMKKPYKKIKDLDQAVNRLEKILLDYGDQSSLNDLEIAELSSIIYNTEKIALSCRQAIEEKEIVDEDYYDEDYLKNCIMNLPIDVDYTNEILKIKTPLTFKRMYRDGSIKENYILMNYVKAALSNYSTTNKELYHSVNVPLVAIIKRISTSFSPTKICDNDNLENGRIINEVMSALGYSDNANVMDIYSCFRLCEDENESGTEFIFVKKDNFKDVFELIK